jgi:hypothetical protein
MAPIDWKTVEAVVFDAALAAIAQLMDLHAASFYAAAFHELYAETDVVIAMPCLAANTVENLGGNEDSRWSSADWKWRQKEGFLARLNGGGGVSQATDAR